MKKYLTIFVIGLMSLAVSCNNNDQTKTESSGEHNTEAHDDHSTGASEQATDTHSKELTLNNGAKWKSDSSTNFHAANLAQITASQKSISNPTLEDHHNTAKKLEAEIGQLVSSCTMKGPDHDALHVWLEPLLGKVKSYNSVPELPKANEIFADIDNHIAAYNTYFN